MKDTIPSGLILASSVENISALELKFVLRMGFLTVTGVPSKHREGYRDYEIVDGRLSASQISQGSLSLSKMGVLSSNAKLKFFESGRREWIYLYNLTKAGLILYFHCKSATRNGLDIYDLEYLDRMLNDGLFILQNFDSKILLRYYDYIELSEQTGYDISRFARAVLESERVDEALTKIDAIKNAFDQSPRSDMKNSDVELVYVIVQRIEHELNNPAPRKSVLEILGHVLVQSIPYITGAATIIGTVIAYLQYVSS